MSRKVVTFIFLFLIVFSFVIAPEAYATNRNTTHVRGKIYENDGRVAKNAEVTCECDKHVVKSKTNERGEYNVRFEGKNSCSKGHVVTVKVKKDGKETHTHKDTSSNTTVDVVINNDPQVVPEYNSITGIAALLFSTGGYMYLKRKNRLVPLRA